MDRVADLQADYERLGTLLLHEADGAKAAALARERRLLGELVDALAKPQEVSVVDELAKRRKPEAEAAGSSSRRRRSRGG